MPALLLMVYLLGFAQSARGQGTIQAAGIIALACKESDGLYLLARERSSDRDGWGHLGGTKEGDEPLLATALREFHEESNCAFDLNDPRSLQFSGPSYQKTANGVFVTYHVKVNYIPVRNIADSTICSTTERDKWVWVHRTDLLASLATTAQDPEVPVVEGDLSAVKLWKPAAAALRQAVKDRVIPLTDPCVR